MSADESSARPSHPAPTELLRLARDIALSAGEFALDARRQGVSVAATKSSPVDVVTAVDRDTEALIRELIAEVRPDDGVFGEEDAARIGTSGIEWVVDPIDGTVNFLYGIPQWAVSIAVVAGEPDPEHWTALAGVVVNPVSGEVFEASAGGGARGNGEELRVTNGVPLDRALIGTGFSYSSERRRAQAAVLTEILPRARDIRRMGSAALDLCALAAGRIDGYYEQGLNPWDHAAGALIAREAGASITGIGGGRESAALLVAAAPELAGELRGALRTAGLDA